MAKGINITYKKRAAVSIYKIGFYIEDKGYPITAKNFINELYGFGNSLADFPAKYPICRKKAWVKRNLRCAVFKKDYIFVHKLIEDELVIYNVVHVSTIG